jgi:OmcA/MtrC family decaheme c-type cytochrome
VRPDASEAYPDSAYAFAGGPARAPPVAQEKCEVCHKKVAIHGGSRAGNPVICAACHNSSVGGTFGTDAYGALALGAFIHGVHAGNVPALGGGGYPQSLGRCEGCHLPGTYNLARTDALPITVNAGTTLENDAAALAWKDDLVDSATAGTCKGCHSSSAAITHMAQQGGSIAAPKSLTPSSSVEGCSFCHAAGRSVDTAAVHE